jgi:hypothetical protein
MIASSYWAIAKQEVMWTCVQIGVGHLTNQFPVCLHSLLLRLSSLAMVPKMLPDSELQTEKKVEYPRPDENLNFYQTKFDNTDSKKLSQLIRPEDVDRRGKVKRFVDKHLLLPKLLFLSFSFQYFSVYIYRTKFYKV